MLVAQCPVTEPSRTGQSFLTSRTTYWQGMRPVLMLIPDRSVPCLHGRGLAGAERQPRGAPPRRRRRGRRGLRGGGHESRRPRVSAATAAIIVLPYFHERTPAAGIVGGAR